MAGFSTAWDCSSVYANLKLVGWGLAVTIVMEALARIANTLGWRVVIEKCPRELTFRNCSPARIAGEAIDYTTPSAQLGGQVRDGPDGSPSAADRGRTRHRRHRVPSPRRWAKSGSFAARCCCRRGWPARSATCSGRSSAAWRSPWVWRRVCFTFRPSGPSFICGKRPRSWTCPHSPRIEVGHASQEADDELIEFYQRDRVAPAALVSVLPFRLEPGTLWKSICCWASWGKRPRLRSRF